MSSHLDPFQINAMMFIQKWVVLYPGPSPGPRNWSLIHPKFHWVLACESVIYSNARSIAFPGRRVDFLEAGKSRFLEVGKIQIFGSREIQKFGVQKMEKMNILKIQIRSAQNVGKVWISRKTTLPALFGAIWGHFFHGPEKNQKNAKILPIFLGGPMGQCPWAMPCHAMLPSHAMPVFARTMPH